ncbi:MAG: CHAT domain-containing protein [Alphaproteobacteria bacterium]|nr:CHAT domain-containing protein [Alphaproteobacteria bacterium]
MPIGTNEVGEPCRYQLTSANLTGVPSRREAFLFCGDWEQPSGHIAELGEGSDPAQLAALASAGPWRTYVDQRFACGAPTPARLSDGAPAVLMQCTRRVGGWPHVALTAAVGGHVFAADAVRPALPALEATLAALTGQRGPAAVATGSEARRLIAQRTVAAFGSGDEGRYFQQTRLGDAYNNIDDPANAERAYREALAIQQKVLGADNPALALTIMKLAAQIAHQQNGAEAERLLARAGQLIAKSGDPLLPAQLDYYRAVVFAYEGRNAEALALAQRAEGEFTRLAPNVTVPAPRGQLAGHSGTLGGGGVESLLTDQSPNSTQERAALSGLAEATRLHATLLQLSGNTAEAALVARRTQQILEANGMSVSSSAARSLRLLASNEAIGRDYPAAAGYSAEAEQVFSRVVPGERPEAINLLSEGAYQLQADRVGAAVESFRRAGAILRSPTVTGGARPEYIGPWLEALHRASGDRAQLDTEMFEAAQFARSGQTAQEIARATARLAAGDPRVAVAIRGYQEKQREFDRLQAQRDQAVAEGAGPDRIAAIDKQIEAARQTRDEAATVIPAAAPRYLEAAEKPVGAAELRSLLAPDEAFVMFFIGERDSFGFLVRPNGLVAYPIPLRRAEVTELVNHLRDSTVAKPGGLPTPDLEASYRLYKALFGPIEPQLAGVAKVSVAASGDLLRYPLEALVTAPGATAENGDYRRVPFLVRRVALAYVPAPRVLANLRHARSAGLGLRPFIGFGDFRPASVAQLAASFPPQRCRDDYQALAGLQRLPDTRTQVATIAQQLGAGPGDIVLGEAFTKARIASPDLAQYRIVLLATHAFLPDTLRCLNEPAITVSASPGAPNADGEFLRVSEIDNLKLNADLVALSACDTAGAGGVGESLSGLARAVFRAGARGLLVTHWDVVTGSSVPLMIGTFSGGNRDSAQALRAAQLRMIDSAGTSAQAPIEISHPNYWAAFVLIGDGIRSAPGV